jgi:3-oxoacyl-[acyl-carrier protein] reductase
MELQGKTAFVTGPAKGMGRAISMALASEGANLVLAGRDLTPIEAVAADARSTGIQTIVSRCDVTNPDDVAASVAEGIHGFGHIDILVNVCLTSAPMEQTSRIS